MKLHPQQTQLLEALPDTVLSADDQRHLQNFEQMRKLLRDRTRSVAMGYQSGAYITGRPGSSKTFTVLEELKLMKTPHTFRNARMTAQGLWVLLSEHPENVIVLDDISSLVSEKAALQILMAALGGVPGQPRTVTYTTAETDGRRSFEFKGGIIAISNVPLRRDPLADAVQSRVPLLEHEPSDEMLAAFMRSQSIQGGYGLSAKEALGVVEFVIAESMAADYRLDLRVAVKAAQDFKLWKDGHSSVGWQDLVRSSTKKVIPISTPAAKHLDIKDEEQQLAKELYQKHPGQKGKHHREKEWTNKTGKSAHTLYRRHRELTAQEKA